MANLTPGISRALDGARRIALGRKATLALLDLAPIGEEGYVTLAAVKRGWSLERGGIGDALTLAIAESRDVTKELLTSAVAFSISGEVYKIDDGQISQPVGDTLRVWFFKVKPTGEQHSDD